MVVTRSSGLQNDDETDGLSDDDVFTPAVNPQTIVVYDPLLAFVSSARPSCSYTVLKETTVHAFSGAQVKTAKNVLWYYYSDKLGPKTSRRELSAQGGRSVKEDNVLDVLDALRRLDEANETPCFAVLASDLKLVPQVRPDDISAVSMTDRLSKLESQVMILSSEVASLRTDSILTGVRADHIPLPSKDTSVSMPPPQQIPKRKKQGVSSYAEVTKTAVETRPAPRRNLVSASSASGNEDAAGFVEPSAAIRRKNRAERQRQKIVTGTANVFKSIAGSDPRFHLFVYNIAPETKEADLREYINDQLKADIQVLAKVSKPEAPRQSFRLTVLKKDFEVVNDPASWPIGIRVRRFFLPRSTPIKPGEIPPMNSTNNIIDDEL